MCTIGHMTPIALFSAFAPPKVSALSESNRAGYRSFISRNNLYPGLAVALCAVLLCLTVPVHAESLSSLPPAPTPATVNKPVFCAVDWSLAGTLVAGRALDWVSTEECLRRPNCREAELPSALARSKVGLGVFEATTSALSIFGQYEMCKHGHRRLARTMVAFNVGVVAAVQIQNYELVTR